MTSIKYDEYDLLELFESHPVPIAEKEAGMFMYSKSDSMGFELVMLISGYEKECSFSLVHEKLSEPLTEISLEGVEKISRSENKLIIQCSRNDRDITLVFKPNFSVQMNL